ncbi:MAG: hypothetical protein COB93_12385 [Sneathiella sp.]|nr:MAG: hypothetical protein COB93_12385 [Sneathiella sp.]
MIKILGSLLLLSLLIGCADTSKLENDFSYGNEAKLALLAVTDFSGYGKGVVYFQPVDLKRSKFIGDTIIYAACNSCTPVFKSKKLENSDTPEFFLNTVPEGTYVLVSKLVREFNSTQVVANYICYNRAVSVFEVVSGRINMVAFGASESEQIASLKKLNTLVSQYPNITADVEAVKTVAVINFESGSLLYPDAYCATILEGRSFDIIKRYNQGTTALEPLSPVRYNGRE